MTTRKVQGKRSSRHGGVKSKRITSSDVQPKKARSVLSTEQPATPAIPTIPPAEAEKPEVLPFDLGEVNRKAPLLTLIHAMFEAPDVPAKFKDPGADFMANVLHSVADDAELYSATDGQLDRTEIIDRAMMRLEWRSRIAVEIARRMQTGEVSS